MSDYKGMSYFSIGRIGKMLKENPNMIVVDPKGELQEAITKDTQNKCFYGELGWGYSFKTFRKEDFILDYAPDNAVIKYYSKNNQNYVSMLYTGVDNPNWEKQVESYLLQGWLLVKTLKNSL